MSEDIPSDPWRKGIGRHGKMETEAEDVDENRLVLAVESGARPAEFPLRPGMAVVIGRRATLQTGSEGDESVAEQDDAGNIVVSRNPHISGRHVRVDVRDNGEVFATDLSSRNGTFVGSLTNRLEPHQPVLLRAGDRLILCRKKQVTFVLQREA